METIDVASMREDEMDKTGKMALLYPESACRPGCIYGAKRPPTMLHTYVQLQRCRGIFVGFRGASVHPPELGGRLQLAGYTP